MNIKNIIQGLSLTIISLAAGFVAVGLPFKLFSNLSGEGLKLFFLIEMTVYVILGGIFLVLLDRKKRRQIKEKQRLIERQKKIDDVIENWYNIAA